MPARVIYSVGALCLCTAAFFAIRFFTSAARGFPVLRAGTYVGSVDGAPFNEEHPVALFARVIGDKGEGRLLPFKDRWPSINISNSDKKNTGVPLLLAGDAGVLRLTGALLKEGVYSGSVENTTSRRSGRWMLQYAELVPTTTSSAEVMTQLQQFRDWNIAWNAQQALRAQLAHNIDEQGRIQRLLAQTDELKTRASNKFEQQKVGLVSTKAKYYDLGKQVRKLQDGLIVARSVSVSGRLTALARESLEREWKWVDGQFMEGLPRAPEPAAGRPRSSPSGFETVAQREPLADRALTRSPLKKLRAGETVDER